MRVLGFLFTGLLAGVPVILGLEGSASAGCNFHGCSQVPGVECNFHGCPNPPNGAACTFHGCPPATPVVAPPPQQQTAGGGTVIVVPNGGGWGQPPQQQQTPPRESLADCIIKIRTDTARRGSWISVQDAKEVCSAG